MFRALSQSLRLKFTLALLATSAAAVASVGGMALWMMDREFDRLALEEAFDRYQGDVARYITTYGSWEVAQQAESFPDFHRRTRNLQPLPTHVPKFRQPPPSRERRPSPERRPHSGKPLHREAGKAPFHFLLLDPEGTVLMGPTEYPVGAVAARSLQRRGIEINVDGDVVALAVPIDRPNLNDLDRAYLDAVRDSLVYGGLAAAGVTVMSGIWVGRRLTRPLTELTAAMQAMSPKKLRQQVPVRTQDELGTLTKSFNCMSVDLANAYEELEESHRTISEQAERLRELSVRDELTQLYNRRYFNIQSEALYTSARRYNRPICFAITDIDHFKRINDTFSHAVGDRVLQRVARILRENSRECDIPTRYGGEEFVMVFPETTLAGATQYCERLRQAIASAPWHDIHPELTVTTSIGLSADVELGGYESMLAAADAKLYEAKHGGRNRVCI